MRTTRPVGVATRGTTNPNRLRRVDHWIVANLGATLRAAADPLVVDLGFGSTPVTTSELRDRLRTVRADVRVIGLEIDRDRVAAASGANDPPGLEFRHGGFELAGLRPLIVRALNVLRQYAEDDVAGAWRLITDRLTPGGMLVEGTCDEVGRLGAWVAVPAGATVPVSLTLAANLTHLSHPGELAERLPKVLIHHNVAGEPIHALLSALDAAWATQTRVFGPRQRFERAVQAVRDQGWPIVRAPRLWRRGELTLPWTAVAAR